MSTTPEGQRSRLFVVLLVLVLAAVGMQLGFLLLGERAAAGREAVRRQLATVIQLRHTVREFKVTTHEAVDARTVGDADLAREKQLEAMRSAQRFTELAHQIETPWRDKMKPLQQMFDDAVGEHLLAMHRDPVRWPDNPNAESVRTIARDLGNRLDELRADIGTTSAAYDLELDQTRRWLVIGAAVVVLLLGLFVHVWILRPLGQSMRALRTANERLAEQVVEEQNVSANIISSSIDGILAFDTDLRYTVWNPAMEQLSGVPATETIGRKAFEVFPFLEEIGEDHFFYEALAGREAISRDRHYTVPSTGRSGDFEARYSPVRDADGKVIGGLAIVHDITDLKSAQARLMQAGRLAAVGQLGAGIAHELNQPLAGIQLMLNLIRDQTGRRVGDLANDLDTIEQQITRMGRIVANVSGFSRNSSFDPRPTIAREPLDKALSLVSEQLRLDGVEVDLQLPDDLPPIRADGMQLQQVFLNLLSNAHQALQDIDGARRITIRAREDDGYVEYRVCDSGPGIPPEVRERVFDPFFTTRDAGHGTGLGLSLSYRIVREHGGEICIDSASPRRQPDGDGDGDGDSTDRPGGACFIVRIPVSVDPPEAPESARAPIPAAEGATGLILVVDDEPDLRRLIRMSVERLGYDCLEAGDADTARHLARDHQLVAALVDMRLPVTDGGSLCRALRDEHPSLPLIVVSGYVTEEQMLDLTSLGVVAVLNKPFNLQELSDTVTRAVGRSPSPAENSRFRE